MVAGLFRSSGAYLGEDSYESRRANPTGFFEDQQINRLNNMILERMLRWPTLDVRVRRRIAPEAHVRKSAFWLAAPRRIKRVTLPPEIIESIRSLTARQPFVYKDPRFSVTDWAWTPHAPGDLRRIVVFRDPFRTCDSILREAGEGYDPPLDITRRWAMLSWVRNYRRLLHDGAGRDDWLFLNYDDVLSHRARTPLEAFVDAELDWSHVTAGVSRAATRAAAGRGLRERAAQRLYGQLLERSRADLERLT